MSMRLSEYGLHLAGADVLCSAHDRLVTIGELAEQHGLSKNHLMKVVNDWRAAACSKPREGAAEVCV
jgi:DNA-binding IscR family transcriptional regulator